MTETEYLENVLKTREINEPDHSLDREKIIELIPSIDTETFEDFELLVNVMHSIKLTEMMGGSLWKVSKMGICRRQAPPEPIITIEISDIYKPLSEEDKIR